MIRTTSNTILCIVAIYEYLLYLCGCALTMKDLSGFFNKKFKTSSEFPTNLDLLYVCDTVDEVLCAASAEEIDDMSVEDLRSVMTDK